MTLYVIQIRLTRTAETLDLTATPLGDEHPGEQDGDVTQFAVLVTAKSARQAVAKVWLRLGKSLAADAVCSLAPDHNGAYLMSIPMNPTTTELLRIRTAQENESPDQLLRHAVLHALARDHAPSRARRGGIPNGFLGP